MAHDVDDDRHHHHDQHQHVGLMCQIAVNYHFSSSFNMFCSSSFIEETLNTFTVDSLYLIRCFADVLLVLYFCYSLHSIKMLGE